MEMEKKEKKEKKKEKKKEMGKEKEMGQEQEHEQEKKQEQERSHQCAEHSLLWSATTRPDTDTVPRFGQVCRLLGLGWLQV